MKSQVLIVDDSATVRGDLRGVLSSAGFATTLCGTLAEARRRLAERTFDLLVLDVVLPDGDGVDLLRELRGAERTAQLPVLLLSTEAAVSHRLRGLGGGANEYVGKPYDASYVVKRACELVRLPEPTTEPRLVAAARRRKLLVVDDSSTFRHAVADELRKDGHDVILAESGEEALALLKDWPVDCALVDLMMPGMNGIALVQTLRRTPSTHRLPVVMLTARFDGRVMADALAAGADAFFPKTDDLELLRAQIRNVLRRQQVEERPASLMPRALAAEDGEAFLAQVADRSGLAPAIATSTLSRACRRAGVDARHLTPADIERVLPALRETLRLFLSEEETARRISAIQELARPARAPSLGTAPRSAVPR